AGSDPCIGFRNGPLVAVFITDRIAALAIVIAGVRLYIHDGFRPCVLGGIAVFIADPAYGRIGSALEDHAFAVITGLYTFLCLNGVIPALEVIILRIGAASFCAVHPDLGKMPVIAIFVISKDLIELVDIVIVVIQEILFCIGRIALGIVIAIAFIMDVPR